MNHQKVFEQFFNSKNEEITLDLIKKWHKDLFFQTKPEYAGDFRTRNVKINGSTHVPPDHSQVRQLMINLIKFYQDEKPNLNPVIIAGLFHLYFEQIHPINDGNGRIGRLLIIKILFDYDYPMLNIKFEQQHGYFNVLEQSILKKDEKIFLTWFLESYCDFDYFELYYNS